MIIDGNMSQQEIFQAIVEAAQPIAEKIIRMKQYEKIPDATIAIAMLIGSAALHKDGGMMTKEQFIDTASRLWEGVSVVCNGNCNGTCGRNHNAK